MGIFADGTYGEGWNGVKGTVTGLVYGDGGQLLAQVAHAVLGFIWAFGTTYVIFKIARNFMQTRVSEEVELEGLDVGEFGALCYPDFVLATARPSPAVGVRAHRNNRAGSKSNAGPMPVPAPARPRSVRRAPSR